MSFREFQARLDLQAAALKLLDSFSHELGSVERSIGELLSNSLHACIPIWQLEISSKNWDSLTLKSCKPGENYSEFLFATCLLLLDRFENPARGSDFEWEWDAYADEYRNAPNQVRAALMNGLREGQKQWLISKNICPSSTDFSTYSRPQLVSSLVEIARSMTPEVRASVARNDYGSDVEKHLISLNSLLETKDCRFQDTWFPAEVVELESHVPTAVGFVGCTALVLTNAIHDDDHVDQASFRWENNSLVYQGLDAPTRRIILMAFRFLYENLPDWDPYWSRFNQDEFQNLNYIPREPYPEIKNVIQL